MKLIVILFAALLFAGCSDTPTESFPVSSESEVSQNEQSESNLSPYEAYLSKERYYVYDEPLHLDSCSFSGSSAWRPLIYTHPAKIDAAYYGNSQAIFFLSEGEVYRLHIESETLDLLYQNEEILSFRPLTNYRILIGLPNPENAQIRPFDPERKDDLFYIVDTKTGKEEPFYPENHGHDGNILRSLNFVPPESIYTIPGEEMPEHKISEEPRIWQSREAYLSTERYINYREIYHTVDPYDAPERQTVYNKARGEYYPIYKHDERIEDYGFDSGQIGYIQSGDRVYRLFLPDFTGEVFYQSDDSYAFTPLSTHAIMLLRENPRYIEENWDYNRENGIAPNRMFIYSTKTGQEKEIFREDFGYPPYAQITPIDPETFYTIEE